MDKSELREQLLFKICKLMDTIINTKINARLFSQSFDSEIAEE